MKTKFAAWWEMLIWGSILAFVTVVPLVFNFLEMAGLRINGNLVDSRYGWEGLRINAGLISYSFFILLVNILIIKRKRLGWILGWGMYLILSLMHTIFNLNLLSRRNNLFSWCGDCGFWWNVTGFTLFLSGWVVYFMVYGLWVERKEFVK